MGLLPRSRLAGLVVSLVVVCPAVFSQEVSEADDLVLLTARTQKSGAHSPQIPANVHFNYKFNLLDATDEQLSDDDGLLKVLKRNCQHTVDSFGGDVENVYFWDDKTCIQELKDLKDFEGEKLARGFQDFQNGRFKSDLCRLAQLYKYGGYYFDTDLLPVTSLRKVLEPETTFATCRSVFKGAFFQAFLAATPQHPFIADQLRAFSGWLSSGEDESGRMTLGCDLLGESLQKWSSDVQDSPRVEKDSQVVRLFQEDNIDRLRAKHKFAGLAKGQAKWKECRVAVVDEASKQVVFYSRVVTTNHNDVCTEEMEILGPEA